MAEVNTNENSTANVNTEVSEVKATPSHGGGRPNDRRNNMRRPQSKRKQSGNRFKEERLFDKKIISIRRVTRVNKGGKRMRLSVCLVIGDKKGRIGIGLGKGADVKTAEEKAYNYAVKHLINVKLSDNTIPHEVQFKRGAAKIFMKPAAPGTGVVAGSSLRAVLEVAGVKDILTKIIGTNNQIGNAYAAIEALATMKSKKTEQVQVNADNNQSKATK